jgi:hypothetical protein
MMNEVSPTNMGCTVVLCGNTMEPPTTRKIKICSCDSFRVDYRDLQNIHEKFW